MAVAIVSWDPAPALRQLAIATRQRERAVEMMGLWWSWQIGGWVGWLVVGWVGGWQMVSSGNGRLVILVDLVVGWLYRSY